MPIRVLRDCCQKKGITTRARRIAVGGGTLGAGMDEMATTGGSQCCAQRHSSHCESDLQWISPADEDAHQDLPEALQRAGFGSILKAVGAALNLEGLAICQMSFVCISKCSNGRLHHDVRETGGKGFNIIVPIILAKNAEPELEIQLAGDECFPPLVGDYRCDTGEAMMLGDDVLHATGEVNYLKREGTGATMMPKLNFPRRNPLTF